MWRAKRRIHWSDWGIIRGVAARLYRKERASEATALQQSTLMAKVDVGPDTAGLRNVGIFRRERQLLGGGSQNQTPERDLEFAIRSAMNEDRVRSYRFEGYWCDLDDVEASYRVRSPW